MQTCGVYFIAFIALVAGEIIKFDNCVHKGRENLPSNCTIHEVRVDPCKEAADNLPCRLKRGESGRISFDYTANFEGNNLESRAYWTSDMIDVPLLTMEKDACAHTTCPAKTGQRQTYSITLEMSKTFPARSYDLKWKLWNEQEQECCFKFKIKLHK